MRWRLSKQRRVFRDKWELKWDQPTNLQTPSCMGKMLKLLLWRLYNWWWCSKPFKVFLFTEYHLIYRVWVVSDVSVLYLLCWFCITYFISFYPLNHSFFLTNSIAELHVFLLKKIFNYLDVFCPHDVALCVLLGYCNVAFKWNPEYFLKAFSCSWFIDLCKQTVTNVSFCHNDKWQKQ